MRKRLGTGIFFGVFALFTSTVPQAFGQNPNMIPPGVRREPRNPDEAAYREQQIRNSIEDQSRQQLRDAERRARESMQLRTSKTRKMTREEKRQLAALLAPDPSDLDAHEAFLKLPRTGILKLFPDADCVTKHVVRLAGPCSELVPDLSRLSFGRGTHSPDIHFNLDEFVGTGFFSQHIIVDLGDQKLDDLNLTAQGINSLHNFELAASMAVAREQHLEIKKGFEINGYFYSDRQPVRLDHSYAIRIVAYRNSNGAGFYLGPRKELSNDAKQFLFIARQERKDRLLVFRVIRQSDDGSITVVWREIARRKSPLLNFRKDEPVKDFRAEKEH